MERKQRYENNWKLALNAQGPIVPMTERENYFEAVVAIKDLRQKDDQESNHPNLPSHQTRQRTFHSRKTLKMEYLSRVIFVLVGMDRIAILVDLPQVGGLPTNLISFSHKEFRLQEVASPLQATGACQQHTAPRTFHNAETFLARGARLKLLRFVCLKNNHSRALVMFRTLLEPAPFSSTLSTPTSSSPCFILRTRHIPVHRNRNSCLAVLPKSPITDSSGTEDPTPTLPKYCEACHPRLMPALAPATDLLALENEPVATGRHACFLCRRSCPADMHQ